MRCQGKSCYTGRNQIREVPTSRSVAIFLDALCRAVNAQYTGIIGQFSRSIRALDGPGAAGVRTAGA